MSLQLKIKNVRLQSGEHFPVLLDTATGLPLDMPNIHALVDLRGNGLQFNSIRTAMVAVKKTVEILIYLDIDIEARLREGKFLNNREIEAFCRWMSIQQKSFNSLVLENQEEDEDDLLQGEVTQRRRSTASNVVSLESVRASLKDVVAPKTNSEGTISTYMVYARRYLKWMGQQYLDRLSANDSDRFLALSIKIKSTDEELKLRTPSCRDIDLVALERMALTDEVEKRLKQIAHWQSEENPWKKEFVRLRNHLIVMYGLAFGMRRSEKLILKLKDIDVPNCMITIHRRPDDPDDTRRLPAATKTLPRILQMHPGLLRLTLEYIKRRREVSGANTNGNGYLFLSSKDGRPLTTDSIDSIYKTLRARCPDLPADLTDHVLRHTWNKNFSRTADAQGWTAAEEIKRRSYVMGWRINAGNLRESTAEIYTRRETREEANKAVLQMQEDRFLMGFESSEK